MATEVLDELEVKKRWQAAMNDLAPAVRGFFKACRPELEDGQLKLGFWYPFHFGKAGEYMGDLEPIVRRYFGEQVVVTAHLDTGGEPAKKVAAQARTLAPDEHPLVREVLTKLKGRIVSVEPVDRGL